MAATPLVSIVIPTYNRADLLPEAIASVLGQSMPDLELIVVDDGSTDRTPEVAASFRDRRLRYVRQPNSGRSAARNHGARLAQGEYLGFLDSDDCYLANATETHLAVFLQYPETDVTVGGYEYIDEQGRVLGQRRPWQENRDLSLMGWLFNCYATPGSVLMRRTCFERVGGFDPVVEIAEDWDLFLRLVNNGCCMRWVEQAVCQYRQHPGGSVHAIAKHRDGALRALDKLFHAPGLRPELVALENQAKAWVHIAYGKKAWLAGDTAFASAAFQAALELDPALMDDRRLNLLTFLLRPSNDKPGCATTGIEACLPVQLGVSKREVCRIRSSYEMELFRTAIEDGAVGQAIQHWWAGIRLDPHWLARRSLWMFVARRTLSLFHRTSQPYHATP